MTREEAIKILKEDGCGFCTWQSTNPYECENKECEVTKAFEMAIKALSQEPCDDAISREDAIESIASIDETDGTVAIFTGKQVIALLKELPSVTQKSGHWIETEYHRWRCSVCREKGMSEWDNIHGVRTNYCPNCGARMESEDKE